MDDLLLLKKTFRKLENCSWMRNHQPRFFPSIKTNIWSDHFSITWLLVSWFLIDLRSHGNTSKFNWCIIHTCQSKTKTIIKLWSYFYILKQTYFPKIIPQYNAVFSNQFRRPYWNVPVLNSNANTLSHLVFPLYLMAVLHKGTEAIKSNKKLWALRLIFYWFTIQWIPFATVMHTWSPITFISSTMKGSHLNNPHSTYSSQKYNIQSICTALATLMLN